MSLLLGGWVYLATGLVLLLFSGSLYWHYIRRKASNPVAFLVFSLTLSTVLLLCLLVPLDILIVSQPVALTLPPSLAAPPTRARFEAPSREASGFRVKAVEVYADAPPEAAESLGAPLRRLAGENSRRAATGLPVLSQAASASLPSVPAGGGDDAPSSVLARTVALLQGGAARDAAAFGLATGSDLMQKLQNSTELPTLSLDALTLKQLYLALFSVLLFFTYLALPFAFFYSRHLQRVQKGRYGARGQGVGEPVPPFAIACAAAQQTLLFAALLFLLLFLALTQRPAFQASAASGAFPALATAKRGLEAASASVDYVLRYTALLFDLNHSGADSLLFVFSALLAFGQLGWVVAGAYGLAALPVLWLRGRMTPQQQHREVQREIAELREQQRRVQSKYVDASGGANLKAMSDVDRAKLQELQAQQQQFTQRKYRLQEEEQQQEQSGCFLVLYRAVLLPFRWTFALVFFLFSLFAIVALFLALLQRLQYSRCTYSCGFVLDDDATAQENSVLYNPLDELLVRLSQYFPADLLLVELYMGLLFLCLLYGLFSLRVRICKKTFCKPVRAGRTPPESLLALCFLLVHFLLAASQALLSMSPRYASFGAQTFVPPNGSDPIPCSLQAATTGGEEAACRMSFFAAVFSRAAIAYPSFANFLFFSSWIFLGVYALCVSHCLLTRRKQPYLSDRWLEEDETAEESLDTKESLGLLMTNGASSTCRADSLRGEEEGMKLLAQSDDEV
ncbi:hypothetical protein BESB_071630 [Besnoitia besnoiti]|uniref:Uncharacterized protein n=1 Tax=Besnoitia besnoiti TaxID=94643 RepID=A0A2A9MCG9_BESBE|nr:uncharacterized protein BESB_071630 [Besnoitia besnoiti]PFH34011.1 hypothetical protein BESB_071630 [Besnoitia besnoiti]